MKIVINNRIFNLDRYDYVEMRNQKGSLKDRIAFIRDGEEIVSAQFESQQNRNEDWEDLKESVHSLVHSL